MSLLSWRNRRPRPAILFEGGLPSRTRFKNGEALNCLSILAVAVYPLIALGFL